MKVYGTATCSIRRAKEIAAMQSPHKHTGTTSYQKI